MPSVRQMVPGGFPVVLHPVRQSGLVGVQLGRPTELPARLPSMVQLQGSALLQQFALAKQVSFLNIADL